MHWPCSCMPFAWGERGLGDVCFLCCVVEQRRNILALCSSLALNLKSQAPPSFCSLQPPQMELYVFHLRLPSSTSLSFCLESHHYRHHAQSLSAATGVASSLIQHLPRVGTSLTALDSHLVLLSCLGSSRWWVELRLEPDSRPESIHQLKLCCLLCAPRSRETPSLLDFHFFGFNFFFFESGISNGCQCLCECQFIWEVLWLLGCIF